MSTYTRTTKSNGTTEWAANETILHSEHNNEWNTFLTDYNGGITSANLSNSAGITNGQLLEIAVTKVSDYSSNAAAHLTTVDAGSTGTLNAGTTTLPTDLSDELERLRYRFLANSHMISTYYMNSSAVATAIGWVEAPIVGPQLLVNNGFELKSSATANVTPDGWTAVGPATSYVVTAAAESTVGLYKRSLVVTSAAANDGLSQVVSGLKKSTKYVIGMAYVRTSATVALQTSGGLASGDYQNLSLSDSSTSTISYMQGVVQTTSSAGDITVKILNTLAGGSKVAAIYQIWMYEVRDQTPIGAPSIPLQNATSTTPVTYPTSGWTGSAGAWRTTTLSTLSLSQYIPASGYRLIYSVRVPFHDIDATTGRTGCRLYGSIQLSTGGGASTVSGPVLYETIVNSSDADTGGTIVMDHVIENPTPGLTYSFTFLLGVYDDSAFEQVSIPPLVGGVQMESRARLVVERI